MGMGMLFQIEKSSVPAAGEFWICMQSFHGIVHHPRQPSIKITQIHPPLVHFRHNKCGIVK